MISHRPKMLPHTEEPEKKNGLKFYGTRRKKRKGKRFDRLFHWCILQNNPFCSWDACLVSHTAWRGGASIHLLPKPERTRATGPTTPIAFHETMPKNQSILRTIRSFYQASCSRFTPPSSTTQTPRERAFGIHDCLTKPREMTRRLKGRCYRSVLGSLTGASSFFKSSATSSASGDGSRPRNLRNTSLGWHEPPRARNVSRNLRGKKPNRCEKEKGGKKKGFSTNA